MPLDPHVNLDTSRTITVGQILDPGHTFVATTVTYDIEATVNERTTAVYTGDVEVEVYQFYELGADPVYYRLGSTQINNLWSVEG